jgi:hypothetical protein
MAAHLAKTPIDKVPNLEDYVVLEYFEYMLKEVPGLPPRRDIDFSINLRLLSPNIGSLPITWDILH